MAGLLYHLGCTGFAARQALFADDDIALRASLSQIDRNSPWSIVGALLNGNGRVSSRVMALIDVGLHHADIRESWMREACGAARGLASPLGCDAATLLALDEVYERWDGQGGPRALSGDEISQAGRVMQAAHVGVLFHLAGGADAARAALHRAAGATLDPAWADSARAELAVLDDPGLLARAFGADETRAAASSTTARLAAEVFGEFADLQTPHTRGHARAVAELAAGAAALLSLPVAGVQAVVLAAHLHDVGHAALPAALWMQARPWRSAERLRACAHAQVSERLLAQAEPLAEAARIAGAHHERLDGSGYPRGQGAARLDRPARLLAVVEVACGMREARAHRGPHGLDSIARHLGAEVAAGRLDAACVEAVLASLGQPRKRPAGAGTLLTEREIEVLRLLATGQTNKQIAKSLAISDRTVQTHTVRIYEKLAVDTRAGAALVAAREGWL